MNDEPELFAVAPSAPPPLDRARAALADARARLETARRLADETGEAVPRELWWEVRNRESDVWRLEKAAISPRGE